MWVNFVIAVMSYNHQNGQTGPFMVWLNGKKNSALVNFVLESLKNGHESLKLVSKMALKKLNSNLGPFHPENQEYLFQMFCCSWKFSAGIMIQKVMFYLFFFQTDFLEAFCKSYGEQPGYLVGGGRGRIMVFCTLLWDVE